MKKSLLRPLTTDLALVLATGLSGAYAASEATTAAPAPSVPHASGTSAPANSAEPGQAAMTEGSASTGAQGGRHGKAFGDRARADMRDGVMIPGIGPLPKAQLDALKLADAQQKQVEAARAAQREAHEAMRAAHRTRHELMSRQLADGKLDPHALAASSDQARQSTSKDMADAQAKGLAVWDSLDDTQRASLTAFVKARQQKMQARHEKRGVQATPDKASAPKP